MGFFKRFKQPKATLSLEISKNEVLLGDELNGIAKVTCQEELEVEKISVLFVCVESVKKTRQIPRTQLRPLTSRDIQLGIKSRPETIWTQEEYEETKTLFSNEVKLSDPTRLNEGFSKDYPFLFKVPSIGRETFRSVDNNVKWSISADMKIKDRLDVHSSGNCEILVMKPSASTATIKEIIREVVLIPCTYCSGLMPQTSTVCPNCGAKRKS
jgi:hypothetical protein